MYLEHDTREELTSRKQVWGTDVYTDDSDVIAACIHAGWFRGAWPDDIDTDLLGLELSPEVNGKKAKKTEKTISKKGELVLHAPPERGPLDPPADHDVEIKILILPALETYIGCTRFGIKSRTWTPSHDGGSFMVIGVKFVDGLGPVGPSGTSRSGFRRARLLDHAAEAGGDLQHTDWVIRQPLRTSEEKAAVIPAVGDVAEGIDARSRDTHDVLSGRAASAPKLEPQNALAFEPDGVSEVRKAASVPKENGVVGDRAREPVEMDGIETEALAHVSVERANIIERNREELGAVGF